MITRLGEIRKAASKQADTYNRNLLKYFEMGAEWADSNPHWISVESELPNDDRNVLAITVNEEIRILYYHEVYKNWYDDNDRYPRMDFGCVTRLSSARLYA
jgi:hypothetical protein